MNSEFRTRKKLGPGPMPAAVPLRLGVDDSGTGEFTVDELSDDAFGVDVLIAQLPPA
jgi:hypothetical protein